MAGRRTEGASSPILVIDVAHPPRQPDAVEEELLRVWMEVRKSSSLRILKIVHGYGSSGKEAPQRKLSATGFSATRAGFAQSLTEKSAMCIMWSFRRCGGKLANYQTTISMPATRA